MMAPRERILIVGGVGGSNVGESLLRAAKRRGHDSELLDSASAYSAARIARSFYWYFRGRRPARLDSFGESLIERCDAFRPDVVITTGLAPVLDTVLSALRERKLRLLNFLTDDPWNRAHRAGWFLQALPQYDIVFSPRRANISDLKAAGCMHVHFLPFGHDPDLFFRPNDIDRDALMASEVVFAGGADEDRVPYMRALYDSGLKLALYGDYWRRHRATRSFARGQADLPTLRRAIASAKVGLCLVRRANRDGNCMRTFEVPAIGTCMLTEDTAEHREIFGEEGEAVLYFHNIETMIAKAKLLCGDSTLRNRLAERAQRTVVHGGHDYADRLEYMLSQSRSIAR
jgi:spore maturation protein CgeB